MNFRLLEVKHFYLLPALHDEVPNFISGGPNSKVSFLTERARGKADPRSSQCLDSDSI